MPATIILLPVHEPCTRLNWDSSEVDREIKTVSEGVKTRFQQDSGTIFIAHEEGARRCRLRKQIEQCL